MTVQIYILTVEFFEAQPLTLYFTNEVEALVELKRLHQMFTVKNAKITVDKMNV